MKNNQKNTPGKNINAEQAGSEKTYTHNKQPYKLTYGKQNYILLSAGVLLVIIGFLLMIGGGSENPDVFQKEELFSFRRITMAPIIVLSGYGVIIYAILKKRND